MSNVLSVGYSADVITKGEAMTIDQLLKHANLSEVARILSLSAPAVYKWKKTGKVPDLRVYQLREKKPEWFKEEQ